MNNKVILIVAITLTYLIVSSFTYANLINNPRNAKVQNKVQVIDDREEVSNEDIEAIIYPERRIKFDSNYKAFYDANKERVYPISYKGATYLPIRAVSEITVYQQANYIQN